MKIICIFHFLTAFDTWLPLSPGCETIPDDFYGLKCENQYSGVF